MLFSGFSYLLILWKPWALFPVPLTQTDRDWLGEECTATKNSRYVGLIFPYFYSFLNSYLSKAKFCYFWCFSFFFSCKVIMQIFSELGCHWPFIGYLQLIHQMSLLMAMVITSNFNIAIKWMMIWLHHGFIHYLLISKYADARKLTLYKFYFSLWTESGFFTPTKQKIQMCLVRHIVTTSANVHSNRPKLILQSLSLYKYLRFWRHCVLLRNCNQEILNFFNENHKILFFECQVHIQKRLNKH